MLRGTDDPTTLQKQARNNERGGDLVKIDLNMILDFDENEEGAGCITPRDLTQTEADLDESLHSASAEMNMSNWEMSSCRSACSPSQQTFHDWFRERRISDESEWQPDLAEMCLQLAGEDVRVFALEESSTCSMTRADSSGAISEMNNRFVGACFSNLAIFNFVRRSQWSPLWIPSDSGVERDFRHGKGMLKSMDFDAMSYSTDTLTELAVEIFMEVLYQFTSVPAARIG